VPPGALVVILAWRLPRAKRVLRLAGASAAPRGAALSGVGFRVLRAGEVAAAARGGGNTCGAAGARCARLDPLTTISDKCFEVQGRFMGLSSQA
jgi:hypothetical protein